LTLISFIKEIQKQCKNENSENISKILKEKSKMELFKTYYHYAKTNFEVFIHDLHYFNEHSSSLFEKIKKASVKNIHKMNENFQKIMRNTKSYDKLKTLYGLCSQKLNDTTGLMSTRMFSLKMWINESVKSCPDFFYQKYTLSKIYIYDKIVNASKSLLVMYKDKYTTFLIENISNAKNSFQEISTLFAEKADVYLHTLEKSLNERDGLIKLSTDYSADFLRVDIDNRNLMLNPSKIKSYTNSMIEVLRSYTGRLQSLLINRYMLFLGSTENNKDKET
jgi:hypothetical protein